MDVRRATQTEHQQLCITAMRAFIDDPVMRWLFPDDEEYLAPKGAVFHRAFAGWLGHNEVWCTDDVAGLGVWIPPGRPPSPTEPPPGPPPSAERAERFAAVGAAMDEHTPHEEHWYLQLLATHPDWQRQGIGARVMAPMFRRADEEGLACYLETETAQNVAYYRHHGFEVRSEWDVAADGPHMWGMIRAAR